MKKIIMTFAAMLAFTYASAQLEPKTRQLKKDDTIGVQQSRRQPADKTVIANKSILKRNTLESGMGKPSPVKKDIESNNPMPTPVQTEKNRVELVTDTITRKK
ncbi:MAG: hypothetical protein M0D53_15265 [Flavobacterium sp. JAD_PAG50586_2]|nr:MAG: hypothetical protein M0D53_15265 [Flavobacterium sp. JAD_PAG50586_2]